MKTFAITTTTPTRKDHWDHYNQNNNEAEEYSDESLLPVNDISSEYISGTCHGDCDSDEVYLTLKNKTLTLRRCCVVQMTVGATILLCVCLLIYYIFILFWSRMNVKEATNSVDFNLDNHRPILNFRYDQKVSSLLPSSEDNGVAATDRSSNYAVFKILQVTDIHLGEAEDRDWGPEQDRKTWRVLDRVITMEDPDLIVLSGDQLTANNCRDNATSYYQLLGDFLTTYNIPWAMIFGNHDDLDFQVPGENKTIPNKYSRRDLMQVDQTFPLSLSQIGPSDVFGTSNYVIDIHLDGIAAAQIYFLDSGGGFLPKQIDESQIRWLEGIANASQLPAVAFQHIPTRGDNLHACSGSQGEGIAPLDYDAGILETLSNYGRFSFLAVGHNHGNDYCCHYKNSSMHLCFGRHSGYGGYGKWARGSRVYELSLPYSISTAAASNLTTTTMATSPAIMNWKSWVRLESGEIVDKISVDNN